MADSQGPSNEYSRTAITAPDPDGAALAPFLLGSAGAFRLGAAANKPGATISLSLYFLNSKAMPVAVQRVQFTTGATADFGGAFVATAQDDPCWPTCGAKGLAIKVDSVSDGIWSIAAMTG